MPYFSMDIEIDEFLNSCDRRDIKELIVALVEDGHLPKNVLNIEGNVKKESEGVGKMEKSFKEKLETLSKVYYSLSSEDEEVLEKIFQKYL